MINLPKNELCTGCGSCGYNCPQNAISFNEDSIGCMYPSIDESKCVKCHKCERCCPVLNPPNSTDPQIAYAAWSKNINNRCNSASGGVAYEFYHYAFNHGYKVIGAVQESDMSVKLKIAEKKEDIEKFRNSKYVFSELYSTYQAISDVLQYNKVLFIGLPCQVAAVKKTFRNHENLLLVEILCHGVTPLEYLRQHILHIESETGKKTSYMYFRDPNVGTNNFAFSLYEDTKKCFYSKKVNEGDSYQYGYHSGVTYRPNCYSCTFATPKRTGDIVLSDFWGLGRIKPCDYRSQDVSCVLIITSKGETFVKTIALEKKIYIEKRPLDEALIVNKRLLFPTHKTSEAIAFNRNIKQNKGNFEQSINELAINHYKRENASFVVKFMVRVWNKMRRVLKKKKNE